MKTAPRVLVTCTFCNKEFEVRIKDRKLTRKNTFCSKECHYSFMRGKTYEELHGEEMALSMKQRLSELGVGEGNPNYGNTWSNDLRLECGQKRKQMYIDTPELRYLAGTANRGKTFSEERRRNMAAVRIGQVGTPHTEESKKKIGIKSAEKFTEEFRVRLRESMEKVGKWVPIDQLSAKEEYDKAANWSAGMWDYVTDSKQLELLSTYGVLNTYTNNGGVCRDHAYSRMEGLLNSVPAVLLRHPRNCHLLLMVDNIKKGSKSSIALEELLFDILTYSGKYWHEQDECVNLIKENYNEFYLAYCGLAPSTCSDFGVREQTVQEHPGHANSFNSPSQRSS